MKITGIHLPGFGCLSDFSCEPTPGLNVVFGDNEAGKSTLQQAIAALLYGFYDGDRARAEETARHDRFRPWNGGTFRGSLDYELDDGRRFEVRRDFSTVDVITQVLDSTLGTEVSGQFGRARHGNVPFARRHLGMSRAVFQSCAFISQGEIFDLQKASPSEIGDAIAALADSARRDVSAARAIERLESAIARIGSDRARTAELPVARDRKARARTELEATDAARRAVAEKAARLDELQARLRRLSRDVIRTRYLLHQAHATAIQLRLRQIAGAESALSAASDRAAALQEYAALTPGLRDQIAGLQGQLAAGHESVQRLEAQHAAAAATLSPDDRLEYESLRLSVGQLTEEQVRGLEAQAYRQPERGGVMRVIRAVVSGIGRIISFILRRRKPEPDVTPPPPAPAEALELLERHRRYLALRPLVERFAAVDQQLEAERASRTSCEARLQAALAMAGIGVTSLNAALQVFAAAWHKRDEYLEAQSAAEDARQRLSLLLSGSTAGQVSERLDHHTSELSAMVARHPSLSLLEDTPLPADLLDQDLQQLQDEQRRTEVAAGALAEEVRLAMEPYRARAEIEEDLAHWSREADRLQTARSALQLAKATIEEAMTQVYRDFAPTVNSFLSDGIEAVTDGRYTRAHVDPSTLRVSLLVPETGLVVTDPPVSHGTRTLIYILMRIGLAQHMSAIGESVPLILDDPFVDLDGTRLTRFLDFLLTLSTRMQILLFTKDPQVVEWFERHAAGSAAHRLHPMRAFVTSSL